MLVLREHPHCHGLPSDVTPSHPSQTNERPHPIWRRRRGNECEICGTTVIEVECLHSSVVDGNSNNGLEIHNGVVPWGVCSSGSASTVKYLIIGNQEAICTLSEPVKLLEHGE